jgi:hypothetical protein
VAFMHFPRFFAQPQSQSLYKMGRTPGEEVPNTPDGPDVLDGGDALEGLVEGLFSGHNDGPGGESTYGDFFDPSMELSTEHEGLHPCMRDHELEPLDGISTSRVRGICIPDRSIARTLVAGVPLSPVC